MSKLPADIKTELTKRHGGYNFNGLVKLLEKTKTNVLSVKLLGHPIAMTTLSSIMLDMERLNYKSDRFLFYLILHELGHAKRIIKFGEDETIKGLSLESFNELNDFLVNEEIEADKYACKQFLKLNGELLPWIETQQLDLEQNKKRYEQVTMFFHGKFKNDKQKYNEWVNSFVAN